MHHPIYAIVIFLFTYPNLSFYICVRIIYSFQLNILSITIQFHDILKEEANYFQLNKNIIV